MWYLQRSVILLLTLGLFFTKACTQKSIFLSKSGAQSDSCLVSLEDDKTCDFRGSYVKSYYWNHLTGYYCYVYTNNFRLNFRYDSRYLNFNCTVNNVTTAVSLIVSRTLDNQIFWYDYTNETSLIHIRKSFKTQDYFDVWKLCAKDARDCCDNYLNETNIIPTNEYPCNALWDGWSCFSQTRADSVAKLRCPKQAYSSSTDVCVLYSQKQCFRNGWNETTDYTVCAIAPVLRGRHSFHVIVLYVSMFFSLPAVIIFTAFPKLRRTVRISLHRNLIIVIILRNILTIMTKEIVLLDALESDTISNHVMDNNGVWCRILALFENAAKNGIFSCMLVDGFYLHKLIVRSFADEPKKTYLYGVAVIFAIVPSLIWATLRGVHSAQNCWMIDTTGDQWVSDGFRFFILGCNLLLLLDIIRVMVTKLKHASTSDQAKTTLRATLFLIPLFGVNMIVTSDRDIVSSDTCYAENIFYYASYSLEASQGVFVSFLFCYLNSEVHVEIQNGYRKLKLHLQQKYGWETRRDMDNPRRTTAQTYVNPQSLADEHGKVGKPELSFTSNRVSTFIDSNESNM